MFVWESIGMAHFSSSSLPSGIFSKLVSAAGSQHGDSQVFSAAKQAPRSMSRWFRRPGLERSGIQNWCRLIRGTEARQNAHQTPPGHTQPGRPPSCSNVMHITIRSMPHDLRLDPSAEAQVVMGSHRVHALNSNSNANATCLARTVGKPGELTLFI